MEKKFRESFNEEECRIFTETVMELGTEWYQYMHGYREEQCEPYDLLKRLLKLFEGDWIGLIDFDLPMKAWSTKYFYNAKTGSTSETLIAEAENTEQAKRWVRAIRNCEPIIIEDIEDIRKEAPEEYEMYNRLEVESVLGVPYRNCSSGLMVVRNPKRFKNNYAVLNIMSYLVTSEIISQNRRKYIERKTLICEPGTEKDIRIHLFGEMEIISKNFVMKAGDMTEPIRFLIAYLALHPGKAFCLEQLNDVYECKNSSWKNQIYRFRTKWKQARGTDEDSLQLIETTDHGYRINQNLNINVDVENVIELMKTIEDTTDIYSKIELLKRFLIMYRGELLGRDSIDCLMINEQRLLYRVMFSEKMDLFLRSLYLQCDYNAVIGFSHDILKVYPKNIDVYAWRISAYKMLEKITLCKDTYRHLCESLDEDEIQILNDKLGRIEKLFDEDFNHVTVMRLQVRPRCDRKYIVRP